MHDIDNRNPTSPRLTVAIPLFHAAPWFDTVAENISRIPQDARILISDETCSDDTVQRIAAHFGEDPRIRLRRGNGSPGWREHCNALIQECDTELFSFLPQDDQIEPGYYEKLVAALDAAPAAGIAFGSLYFEGPQFPSPSRQPSPPFPTGSLEPWMEAVDLDRQWNLGIAFRGVMRRDRMRAIPPTPGDRFADKLWIFGMALTCRLVEVSDAVYRKRIHERNTFTRWRAFTTGEWKALLKAEIHSALGMGKTATQAIERMDQRFEEYLATRMAGWRSLGIC